MNGTTAHKVAVLDLGTNTFNLLLVKITSKAYYIFHNEKVAVMIGKGGINKGIINEEARERALNALNYYRKIIDAENITIVYGYATSAFRDAANGEVFRNLIEEKTGLSINIISGDEEAKYIYRGVQTAFDIGGDNALIMDIGGGSVEFIIGNRDKIAWKKSFNIGAQRLLDWFHEVDPIPIEEINKLDAFFEKELGELTAQIIEYEPKCLIGSSGTFDTLSEIYQHRINRFTQGDETELPLTTGGFEEIHQLIIRLNRQDRLAIPGMIEMRVDMIVVASCLVKYIIDHCGIRQIRVSAHALKEGMINHIRGKLIGNENISSVSKSS
jgi:exopolyphosphatase/guanosine-5'-triphosphate,3'-diphosphate pyrophosphatase